MAARSHPLTYPLTLKRTRGQEYSILWPRSKKLRIQTRLDQPGRKAIDLANANSAKALTKGRLRRGRATERGGGSDGPPHILRALSAPRIQITPMRSLAAQLARRGRSCVNKRNLYYPPRLIKRRYPDMTYPRHPEAASSELSDLIQLSVFPFHPRTADKGGTQAHGTYTRTALSSRRFPVGASQLARSSQLWRSSRKSSFESPSRL